MKKACFIIMLVFVAASLFSCSGLSDTLSSVESTKLLSLYRRSYAVVRAKCSDGADAGLYAAFSVLEVICGHSAKTLYCQTDKAIVGDYYFIFITTPDNKAELNKSEFTLLHIKDDTVNWDGLVFSLSATEKNLAEYVSIVSYPAYTYYYEMRTDFLRSCTDIIIGRPVSEAVSTDRNTYSHQDTLSVERKMKCTEFSVHVISALKGNLVNGDEIDLIYSQSVVTSMIDTTTLSTVSMTSGDVSNPETGSCYIFFLNRSSDVKQNCYFPLNPIQGWIELSRDSFNTSAKNTLFDDCTELRKLVSELNLITQNDQDTGHSNN